MYGVMDQHRRTAVGYLVNLTIIIMRIVRRLIGGAVLCGMIYHVLTKSTVYAGRMRLLLRFLPANHLDSPRLFLQIQRHNRHLNQQIQLASLLLSRRVRLLNHQGSHPANLAVSQVVNLLVNQYWYRLVNQQCSRLVFQQVLGTVMHRSRSPQGAYVTMW